MGNRISEGYFMSRLLASILGTRVTTDNGDFFVGTAENDVLTMDATVVGLGGMAGDDKLTGGTGRDLLFGDYFSAELFSETSTTPLVYDLTVIGKDKLYGGLGGDFLIGGPGNDSLYGGRGNDNYILIGGGADLLVEAADGGIDTISTSASTHTMAANFENLEFANIFGELRKDVHGIGNALNNYISGGLRDDILEGRSGNDTLSGSGGTDVLIGGLGRDAFAFGFATYGNGVPSTGDKADTISDFDPAMDRILLDVFSFYANGNRPPEEGRIKVGQFGLTGAALTGREAVIYDQATGDLMTRDMEVFAHVTPGTVLTFLDFEWSWGSWMM